VSATIGIDRSIFDIRDDEPPSAKQQRNTVNANGTVDVDVDRLASPKLESILPYHPARADLSARAQQEPEAMHVIADSSVRK
jgi:hypothetical protein